MSRKKEIVKDASIYSLSSYAAQLFDVVNGILLRRFLGPTSMGVWAFLQVIQNYAKHAGLGVTTATARDVPYYLGKGDQKRADEIKDVVFTFTFLTACLTGTAIAIYAAVAKDRHPSEIVTGLFVIALLIVLQRVYNLYVVLIRSYKKFVFAGILNILSSVTTLSFTVLLVWRYKLYGFFAALILHYILMIAFIIKKTHYRFTFRFAWPDLQPLLGLGSAMLISDVLRTVMVSIDRIMITKFLGFTSLGFYSIALMANNYLYALPNMLGVIFFPHFQEVFAQRDNPQDLERYLREPTLAIACLFPYVIALVWCASEWIVPILLPQYISGIWALRILIMGSFFMALTHPYANYVITVRQHWKLIPMQAATIAAGFFVSWLFIQIGWGIPGVAASVALISLIHFLILSGVSFSTMKWTREMLGMYLKTAAAFLWFCASLWGSYWILRSWGPSFARMVFQYVIFSVCMSPFLWLAERDLGLITTLGHFVRDSWHKLRKKGAAQ